MSDQTTVELLAANAELSEQLAEVKEAYEQLEDQYAGKRRELEEARDLHCGWKMGDGGCNLGRDNLCYFCMTHLELTQVRAQLAAAQGDPMQPVEIDDKGVVRFRANAIVQCLLDEGPIDMNEIARRQFTPEAQQQFAQLIGYSVDGYADLDYVTDESYDRARVMSDAAMADGVEG